MIIYLLMRRQHIVRISSKVSRRFATLFSYVFMIRLHSVTQLGCWSPRLSLFSDTFMIVYISLLYTFLFSFLVLLSLLIWSLLLAFIKLFSHCSFNASYSWKSSETLLPHFCFKRDLKFDADADEPSISTHCCDYTVYRQLF